MQSLDMHAQACSHTPPPSGQTRQLLKEHGEAEEISRVTPGETFISIYEDEDHLDRFMPKAVVDKKKRRLDRKRID